MPTFTGKKFSNFYKNLLGINQTSNTGVDSTVRTVQDGAGNDTSLSVGTRSVKVVNTTHNTTTAFTVANKDGNNILAVDTTNSKVLGGASQTALNTQYAHFGIDYAASAGYNADTHYAIPFQNSLSAATLVGFGSSTSSSFNDTNPASSLTFSTNAHLYINLYWHVIDNITVDTVVWWSAPDNNTNDDIAAHLMAYTVDISNGSTGGDLSSGVVVADGATISAVGYEQAYYQSMTIQNADVDAGKVILFTFASDTNNADYSINATVKYHIR